MTKQGNYMTFSPYDVKASVSKYATLARLNGKAVVILNYSNATDRFQVRYTGRDGSFWAYRSEFTEF